MNPIQALIDAAGGMLVGVGEDVHTERLDALRAAIPAARAELEKGGAMVDVLAERNRQDAKWGEQNHDPFTYLAILIEEVGELGKAALHLRFGGPEAFGVREEAVQTAAVSLAIVECLDRAKWAWPTPPKENENADQS